MKKIRVKIKEHYVSFIILIILILFSVVVVFAQTKHRVCFEEKCFRVEKAITPEEREKGLMYRYSMDEDKGMLFIFENESLYQFWMKNTFIPLDIIWINSEQEVVFISKDSAPCKDICIPINPNVNAIYVLELNANTTNKYHISVGDSIILN
jgi:uncharacterized membrane protein (UPF0127 family)